MLDTTSAPVLQQAAEPQFREVIVLTPLPVLRPCQAFDAPCRCGAGNSSDCPHDASCDS